VKAALEVTDIFRRHGAADRAEHAATLSNGQRRVMGAIEACRTAVLGGHVERCADCGEVRIAYNSCLMGKCSNGELGSGCASNVGQLNGFDDGFVPRWSP
jgi:hypothetical protein